MLGFAVLHTRGFSVQDYLHLPQAMQPFQAITTIMSCRDVVRDVEQSFGPAVVGSEIEGRRGVSLLDRGRTPRDEVVTNNDE